MDARLWHAVLGVHEYISFDAATANIDFTPFLPINSSGFVYLDDPHLRTPYVYQYNLSLQRNLFADTFWKPTTWAAQGMA